MEIVIEIPEKVYGLLKYFEGSLGFNDEKDSNDDVKTALMRAVVHGTPLPKNHGRLIDADRLTREEIMPFWYHLPNGDIACPKVDIDHAPTIIEGSDSE